MVHGLSCSAACGISPDQLVEPASPALQGRFLTTGPPGKPTICIPESKMFLREELKEGRAKSMFGLIEVRMKKSAKATHPEKR